MGESEVRAMLAKGVDFHGSTGPSVLLCLAFFFDFGSLFSAVFFVFLLVAGMYSQKRKMEGREITDVIVGCHYTQSVWGNPFVLLFDICFLFVLMLTCDLVP